MSWIEVYPRTVEPLYAYVARRAGGQRELAEDVTQETFLRALHAFPEERLPDDPLAYLKTVARNLLYQTFRKREPERLGAEALQALEEPNLEASELDPGALQYGLSRLKEKDRALLEAFYLDRRDGQSLAAELGVSAHAVEGRLHRARQRLRKVLEPFVQGARS